MQIDLQARDFSLTKILRNHVERRFGFALSTLFGWFHDGWYSGKLPRRFGCRYVRHARAITGCFGYVRSANGGADSVRNQ